MPIQIERIESSNVPLEVEPIRPDSLEGKTVDDILRTPIFHGKEKTEFGTFFKVTGNNDDPTHRWTGDFTGVHWIGAGMASGEIIIEGSAGRHVGSEMTGGRISVSGDVSDWVGAELKSGCIHVKGNAGHLVGAAYRGSPRGMTGGTILVEGNAGNEVGHTMRRGMICVGGVGDLAGFNMLAGSILVFGDAGIRHGAGMRRGTIGFFGPEKPDLLPTFKYACQMEMSMLAIANNFVASTGFGKNIPPIVDLYHGDFLEGGRGEILLAAA